MTANWVPVAKRADIPLGEAREFVAEDRMIALFHVDDGSDGGSFHALDGICPHQGGPLGKGSLCGEILTCPWHGWQYNACTGQHLANAALRQPSLPMRLEGDNLLVDLNAGESNLSSAEDT